MQGFTPRPVNQTGAQGEEAGKGIANGGTRQRRRRGQNAYALSRPVNQAGAQGEEAGKGIANGGVRQLLRPELPLN